MVLDNDDTILNNIDDVELSHEILKDLGWTIKYDTSNETTFEHDCCKGTTILLRHYHHYACSKYYTLWWVGLDRYYSIRITTVKGLREKLTLILNVIKHDTGR